LLVALAIVSAGVGWYLLQDEAFLKSQLRSQALKYTGRNLALNGPVQLELGKVTMLEARDIHFANAAWADQPDMVSAGHLKIAIDISSLFDDQIVFPLVSMDEVKVRLVRNDKGEPNWDMFPGSEPETGPPSPRREKLPVLVRDLQINNSEIYLASLKLEKPLNLGISSLGMQHRENARWQGKIAGNVNELPLSLDGWFMPFDSLILGGPLEHKLDISLGEISLQSSGSLKDVRTGKGANLVTSIQGPDIEDLLVEFKLPPFSEGAFDYSLALNTEGNMTKIDLDGDLGSVNIKASGELDQLFDPRDGNVQLSIDAPNLGVLAKAFGVEGLVEDAFSHESHAMFKGDEIHFNKAALKTDSDQLEIGGHFNRGAGFAGTGLTIKFRSDEAGRWTTVFGQPQQALGPLDFDATLSSDSSGLMLIKAKVIQDLTILDVEGSLGHLPDALQPDLNIDFNSPDPSHLAAIVGLQMIPATPLAVEGRIGYKDNQVQLGKIRVDLAGDLTEIDGMISLSDRFAGSDLKLHVDVKNAGDLGRLFGRDGLPEQPMKLGAELKPEGTGLAFKVTDGNLGDIQLELDGRIPDLEQPLKMDGNFDINLPRLNDVTLLFPKIKLPDAPFSVQGKVESKDNAVQIDNLNIDLAGDTATINGLLKLENRFAGSDLHAALDIKNVAALGRLFGQDGLPEQPTRMTLDVKPSGEGMAFELHDSKLGAIKADLTGKIADMTQPLVLDADFDIQLPRLSDIDLLVPQMKLPNAPFSAQGVLQSRDKGVQLNNVIITLADNQAKVNGLLKLENRFAGSDLRAELDIKDAGKLGRLFGKDGLPDEPFKMSVEVKPNGKGMAFELNDGDLRDVQLEIKGQIADLDHPMIMEAEFDIQLPRLSEVSFLFPDKDLPDSPFTAKGLLKNQKTRTHLQQVHLELGEIKATIIGDLLAPNRFDLSLRAGGLDASDLAVIVGKPMPAEPFSLSTQLTGSPAELNFTNLDVELGKSQATGKLTVGLGDVTQIRGQITSPQLDLSYWTAEQDAEEAAPEPTTQRQWMFEETPVMGWMPQGLDVEANIQVSKLILSNTTLSDFELGLKLYDQFLQVKPFSIQGELGGRYVAEIRVDGRGSKPKMHFAASGKDIRAGLLSAPGQDPSSYPPFEVESTLTGRGATHREMASSLNGKTRVFIGSGQIANAGLDLVFSDFLTQLFSTLNPFSKTSEYTQLDCGVIAAEAESGVVIVFPVIFNTEQLTVLSEGTVDLNTENIDLAFNTKPRKGIGLSAGTLINPLIKVGGRLTTPAVEMDAAGGIKSGGLAVATLGISVLAKSLSDRFLSSPDPCGEARKELEKHDSDKK